MKILKIVMSAAFVGTVFCGCQKDAAKNTSPSGQLQSLSGKLLAGASCSTTWIGGYITFNQPFVYEPDSVFINHAIAQLPIIKSPYKNYFTSISLNVPDCEVMDGDNFKFEASLENPDSLRLSNRDYDVNLYIYGSEDTAHVTFEATLQQYTSLQVGTHGVTNNPELLHLFEGFTDVALIAKNHFLSVTINDSVIKRISYDGTNIGQVKGILIGFKNSGKVDWVKLKNTSTGVLYMHEQFVNKTATFSN